MTVRLDQLTAVLIRTGYICRHTDHYLDIACIGALLAIHAIETAPADSRQAILDRLIDFMRERVELAE